MGYIGQILDQDESCRDINFDEALSHEGVIGLLDFISRNWMMNTCQDAQGNSVSGDEIFNALSGSIHSTWVGESLIRHLQLFVVKQPSGNFFAELTFFPRDVIQDGLSEKKIKSFLKDLQRSVQSEKIFLRYENSSWVHGEIAGDVILSHLDL
jgi:hypothetical protein